MAASPTTEGKRASFDSFQSAQSATASHDDQNGHGAAGGLGPSPEQQAQEPTSAAAAEAAEPTVTCPHCDQPLPASLLATHKLGESSRRPRRPTLSASASSPAVPGSGAATPHGESADRPASRRSSLPGEPSGTSESLKTSVDQADASETAASKSAITDDELRRWSSLAGVSLELPSTAEKPAPTPASDAASGATAFPLLPPPPPGAAKAPASKPSPPRAAASTSRFGFFARNKSKADIDSDDDSDDGGAVGYARLAGPGSDDDDDDDGYESDKPFPKKAPGKPEPRAEEAAAAAPEAAKPPLAAAAVAEAAAASPPADSSADNSDLRTLLREVLGRVHTLVSCPPCQGQH